MQCGRGGQQGCSRCVAPGAVTLRVQLADLVYGTVARAAPAALRLAVPFSARLRRALDGRRTSLPSLLAWAARDRDPARPLVWLHAPSVGEALMAQAILHAVKTDAPRVQSIFTFFSPSAERMAAKVGADWHGYLPWDRAADIGQALQATAPACVAFVRTEIWPVLGRMAGERGARVLLLNAVLAEGSSRTGRGARWLLGPAYRRLDAVGAASSADAERLPLLGVTADRIHVTGDARFDQVWRRIESLDRNRPLLRLLGEGTRPLLVAGSTWPADEERLVPALAALRSHGAPWRLVIAPHEPTQPHLAALEARLGKAGLAHARLPADEVDPLPLADVLVVDRVGVLADLYSAADAAYVGGGFGSAGLHSVVEPAALGVPVVYGPRHGNAREAARLASAGGAFIVHDTGELQHRLNALRADTAARTAAGGAARAFVQEHAGGSRRNAQLILEALATTRGRPG
jgi:3-deoxy-D-manno-octulosonic-acid transferase